MSKWAGKYVIGLTGNIGTGKSVVRKMLEHLGAYGIDADTLAHRVMSKGGPGYEPVLSAFGKYILGPDGEIERTKLGRVVFADPEALRQLEDILHPVVLQAIDILIQRSTQKVIVLEAIKLLETDLHKKCDSIWVSFAPQELQLERLMQKRKMSKEDAAARIHAQPSQEAKLAAANVIIKNTGSFEETWEQVSEAWEKIKIQTIPKTAMLKTSVLKPIVPKITEGEMNVSRARPRQAGAIAALINRNQTKSIKDLTTDDMMAAFGDKAFLLLYIDKELVGAIGWQVENLIARVTDVIFDAGIDLQKGLTRLIEEMEIASQNLQAEAALIFIPIEMAQPPDFWKSLGYETRTPKTLGVPAWEEAALECLKPGMVLYFKQMRSDRILRPI